MSAMTSTVIVALSLCWLHASYADCRVSKAADDMNLQSSGESVEVDETSLLQHTRLQVGRRESSANRRHVNSFRKFRRKQRQDPSEDSSDDDDMLLPTVGPNGNNCTVCDPPPPGTGYDGIGIKTSELSATPNLASLHDEGNYVMRDDCGSSFGLDPEGSIPFAVYIYNTTTSTHSAYPGYTNAWCETGSQQVAADTFANRDQLYQGKSVYTYQEHGFTYDFFYCKHNGFLSLSARQALAGSFEAAQAFARNFCSEKEAQFGKGFIEGITKSFMMANWLVGFERDPMAPTKEEAQNLGAFLCAMGGSNGLKGGQSDGSLPDAGYCQYAYGDLGDGSFCMYEECNGWDPVHGMPVTEFATRAA